MSSVSFTKRCCTSSFGLVLMSLLLVLTANGQQLTPSPARIDFANVQMGSTTSQTETLTNGTTTITVSAASTSGTGFGLSGITLPVTLNAGQTVSFTVTFAPTAIGAVTGSLTITSNASTPTLTVPLSGAVLQGNLSPKHASLTFADLQVGTSRDRTETLTNNGGTSVTISGSSMSGTGFTLSGLSPQTLLPGQNTSFTATFHPSSEGLATGSITIASDGSNPMLFIPLSGTADQIKSLPECSLSKTNNRCKLTIDRGNPVAPPTVQMYSNQTLTVIVKNPKDYERYFLDYQAGQATLSPDVASSIVQGFLPSLGKLTESSASLVGTPAPPAATDACGTSDIIRTPPPQHVKDVVPAFQQCLGQLSTQAIDIYHGLEPYLAPDSLTPNGTPGEVDLAGTLVAITAFLQSEVLVSSRISAIAADTTLKVSSPDGPAIQQLTNLQKLADAVATDLMGYSQRLTDLGNFDNGEQECANLIEVTKEENDHQIQCIYINSKPDNDRVYQNMVTRTVTYSLNTLNLISNSQQAAPDPTKKRLLASIAINFADSAKKQYSSLRWEPSAGVFFSTLAVRSFSAAPVFTNGAITDYKIVQNVLHPTVVPFAAANYRISNDLRWTRWRSAIYLTGAVGVNPNTVSADFAAGLSLSWRSLMFSPLWHYGHDVRLTQGLTVGESLGASFKGSIPTQTYWTSSFALGVSIRVPSLTGR